MNFENTNKYVSSKRGQTVINFFHIIIGLWLLFMFRNMNEIIIVNNSQPQDTNGDIDLKSVIMILAILIILIATCLYIAYILWKNMVFLPKKHFMYGIKIVVNFPLFLLPCFFALTLFSLIWPAEAIIEFVLFVIMKVIVQKYFPLIFLIPGVFNLCYLELLGFINLFESNNTINRPPAI